MFKNVIFYFSATGNSLAAAQTIASGLEEFEIIPATAPDAARVLEEGVESVGFVFPVHRGDVPQAIKELLQKIPINHNTYYFAVSTYGFFSRNEFSTLDKELRSKGAFLNYSAAVRMVGNYILLHDISPRIDEKLKRARKHLLEVAEQIKFRQENFPLMPNKILSLAVDKFTHMDRFDEGFNVSSKCTQCDICIKICPAKNIVRSKFGVYHKHVCHNCLACVHWCPLQAIEVGKSTRARARYHHPDVSVEELYLKKTFQKKPAQLNSELYLLEEDVGVDGEQRGEASSYPRKATSAERAGETAKSAGASRQTSHYRKHVSKKGVAAAESRDRSGADDLETSELIDLLSGLEQKDMPHESYGVK